MQRTPRRAFASISSQAKGMAMFARLRAWFHFRRATLLLGAAITLLALGWGVDRYFRSGASPADLDHGEASHIAGRLTVTYNPLNSYQLITEADVVGIEFHPDYVVLHRESGAGSVVQLRLISNFDWRLRE
jgi:hypothetical protein